MSLKHKIKIAVIFGGRSLEHEVSLSSAMGVINALDKSKYRVIPIAITKSGDWLIADKGAEYMDRHKKSAGIKNGISVKESQTLAPKDNIGIFEYQKKNKLDLVLPILHGPYGEDGRIQGMLDMINIPYLFSGVLAHALAMDKIKTKIIVKDRGVRVAKEIAINEKYKIEHILEEISFPVIIKPVELGSSVGISIARSKEELEDGIQLALGYNKRVMVEKYIEGREFTATVMGSEDPEVLAITEIISKISEFYDYKAKYESGGSEHICPAQVPERVAKEIRKSAIEAHKALQCNDLSRSDFIWDEKDGIYFIEINTIPGMTPTSLAPEAAMVAGMNFREFLDRLIAGALRRYQVK